MKAHFFDQPTNGISYVRVKCDLTNLPERLRLFVPMFAEFMNSIGTKDHRYDVFNNKIMSCTNGLKVQIDRYNDSSDPNEILHRKE